MEVKKQLRKPENWEDFEMEFEDMTMMHQARWTDDMTPAKSQQWLECWGESIRHQFVCPTMAYFVLKLDGEPVASRLGVMWGDTF